MNSTTPRSLILQSWLSSHGITPQLAQKYTHSNWLGRLRAGVYYRPGRSPQWQDALHCLITQKGIPARISGLSSLIHQGKAQYIQQQNQAVWLGVPSKVVLPRWFKKFPNENIPGSSDKNPAWNYVKLGEALTIESSYMTELNIKNILLPASAPELAIYETLSVIPKLISFEHAAELFQGLVNLSPRKVQAMLEESHSVKTNRLFLFLANYYQMPWRSRINESRINLGTGNRQIIPGGKWDRQYRITVPEKFIHRV